MFETIFKWFVFIYSSLFILIAHIAGWEGMEMLKVFVYHTVVHVIDQKWMSKNMYCIPWLYLVRDGCKIDFTNWNAKITLLHASMVITYYNNFFWTGADRHNNILMSLLLLVARQIAAKWELIKS